MAIQRWMMAALIGATGAGAAVAWHYFGAAPSDPVAAADRPLGLMSEQGAAPAPVAPADAAPAETDEAPLPLAPSVEVVRIDPTGSGLIAGRAQGGAPLVLRHGEEVLAQAQPEADGGFVLFFDLPPSDQSRRLTLFQDGTSGEPPAVLVAPAPVEEAVAADVTEPAPEPVAEDVPVPAASAPEASEPAPEAIAEKDPEPEQMPFEPVTAPPPVLLADAEGVRVVQGGAAPEAEDALSLSAITYDAEGAVSLAGQGGGGAAVRVYLDNRPVSETPVTTPGDWSTLLPEVEEGVYTLRVDALDAQGAVVSRIETPFRREAAQDVAEVMAEETSADGFDVAVRTVQPGNTLWAIARETYGDGVLYVHVFNANADLIRNPDLIYPGQIFRLPELDAPG